MISEKRAPYRSRLSSSRPSWSTPSQCCDDGPGQQLAPSAFRFTSFGEYGALSGAKIEITTKAQTRKKPTSAPGFRRRRDQASTHSPPVAASSWIPRASSSATDIAASAQPDARVDDRIQGVHDQVDDDEHDGEEEDAALQDRVVAVEDRILEPAADAGPREHRLRQHRSRQQEAGLQADDRRDRQQGVSQHVPRVDLVRRQSLGA